MNIIKPKKIEVTPILNIIPEPEFDQIIPIQINTNIPLSEKIVESLEPKSVNPDLNTVNILNNCDPIPDLDKLKEKLIKLGIRFNTDPKLYQKRDYWLLICILYQALTHLYDIDVRALMVKEWLNPHSDNYIPTEKLVAETIEELDGKLDQEVLDRIQAIADEAALRLQGDLDLSDSLDREVIRLEELISDETSARQSADSDLLDNIDSEAGTRATEITRVEGLISAEELARQQADTNLQNTKQDNLTAGENISITNNVISAVDTIYDDAVISNRVSTIENKIPSEATSSNLLADKAFVHDLIATNASNFRGDWSTWTSVPSDSLYYPEDYTGNKKPNNNDYLIIQNATDYDPSNTGIWRFVYKGDWDTLGKSGWGPQYRVELAFTQELLNAINSGITSLKVSTYDNYQQQIDNLLPLIYAGL